MSQQYQNEKVWERFGCPKGLKRKRFYMFHTVSEHGCCHFAAIANLISSINMLSASAGGTATPKSQLTQLTYWMSRAQLTQWTQLAQLTQMAQLTHSIC